MNKFLTTISFILIFGVAYSQNKNNIETKDIDNFWNAYDKLKFAKNNSDSVEIFQTEYIDLATEYFKEFIKIRNFKAEEYVTLIGKYPKFWNSIRKDTENVKYRTDEIESILMAFESEIPNFENPKICFAIGCLRTGGTVSNNLILIGTEIAASTPETEKSELSPWLKSVVGTSGDILSMVSHETIHTQQKGYKKGLADYVINEGVAEFLSQKITGLTINKPVFEYGLNNDCELSKEFLKNYNENKKDYSNWLYNGNNSKNRPADLGYYIGYRIAEEYYYKSNDSKKAISDLLNRRKYKRIFRKSEYLNKSCE